MVVEIRWCRVVVRRGRLAVYCLAQDLRKSCLLIGAGVVLVVVFVSDCHENRFGFQGEQVSWSCAFAGGCLESVER